MPDDIPGTPGQRTIGGTPLSELGGSDSGSDSGGGGGGGGGGSTQQQDEPDIAPNVSGDAVRRSLEEGISVEEAQREINEEQQQQQDSGSGQSEPEVVEADIDFETDQGGIIRTGQQQQDSAIGQTPFLGDDPSVESRESSGGQQQDNVRVVGPPPSLQEGQGQGQSQQVVDALRGDIPEGNVQNTQPQQNPRQKTQAPGTVTGPGLQQDEDIAESLTTGGLLPEGTRELDDPGQVQTPDQIPGGVNNATDYFISETAQQNPGLSEQDVAETVDRTDEGISFDVSAEEQRERYAAANEGVSPDEVIFQDGEAVTATPGFNPLEGRFVPTERQLRQTSQEYQQGVQVVSTGTGEVFDEVATLGQADFGDNQVETAPGNLAQGVTGILGSAGNVPGYIQTAETGIEVTEGIAEESFDVEQQNGVPFLTLDQPAATAETATAMGAEVTDTAARNFAEQTFESPFQTLGMLGGGAALGVASGAASQRAFTGLRGRLATRGMNFQGDVDIQDIERPDVRSGQSTLTRFSEEAVPGGDRSMDVDDFPAEPASDTATELQNLASEFDNPQIRQALDADPSESTLFTARTGTKGEAFEPRSGRPYDPDAAFFAGSVSRNFLDVDQTPDAGTLSGGLRRPQPVAAVRSLFSAARQEGTPTVVATAGDVRQFPEDIVSARADRPEMSRFLRERANTGEFYTLRPEAGSGEAEALTAARGAADDPMPGANVIGEGEATEFVRVADPLRTEVSGETVPIQMFRQNTPDVTPLSQQTTSPFGEFLSDERGMLGAGSGGGTTSPRTLSETLDSGPSYTPGGPEGTVPYPTFGGYGFDPAQTETPQTQTVESDVQRTQPTGDPTRSVADTDSTPSGPVSPPGTTGGGSPTSVFGTPSDGGVFGTVTSPTGSGAPPSDAEPGTPPSPAEPGPGGQPPGAGTPPSPVFGGGDVPYNYGTPYTPQAPSTPATPFIPQTPPGGPSGRPRMPGFDLDADQEEDPIGQIGEEGQEFVNPVATGEMFLFGTGFEEFDFQTMDEDRGASQTAQNIFGGNPFTR